MLWDSQCGNATLGKKDRLLMAVYPEEFYPLLFDLKESSLSSPQQRPSSCVLSNRADMVRTENSKSDYNVFASGHLILNRSNIHCISRMNT